MCKELVVTHNSNITLTILFIKIPHYIFSCELRDNFEIKLYLDKGFDIEAVKVVYSANLSYYQSGKLFWDIIINPFSFFLF